MRSGGLAMALTKIRLGDFIELYSEKCGNSNLTIYDISGINSDKEFFEPSKQVGANTSNYKNVPPNYFACNLMHVGRDKVLPISLNHSEKAKVVSPAYTVFQLKNNSPVLKDYFFMMLKSKEQDRYFWFHTDSSVRDGMSWDDLCDIEIELPPIDIQQKYVDVYHAMLANQQSYEHGLEDLKLLCDAYIEELRRKMPCQKIGHYLIKSDRKNNLGLQANSIRGIASSKELIPTKADTRNVNLNNYKVVFPNQIAYVPDTSRRGNKMSICLNDSKDTLLVSSISEVFSTNMDKLLARYLMLFFTRSEFDRYARFHSWGSARETFDFDEMCDLEIPIPDIKIQKAISDIYAVYIERKHINERLKERIKNICPILIKGSLDEGRV